MRRLWCYWFHQAARRNWTAYAPLQPDRIVVICDLCGEVW